ncbi:DUF3046 domain-containing protein [Gordonia sp. PDNC005]|jgi:hypothetical protein|uniref:DUF3046 domain-containing protein n=1 Tax=unclassified Gordonia (in: high G+C Gram-positive bacteria) TaxID=2657482 RepID=UPI00196239BB|nr:DUF3046 domain-containing protein [Gordonia sp. PDNC005]MDR2280297.1 DUF3046 domain-containing protein [Gordonia sp. (in: high G+C Gram-positive bacteria)]QRY63901.1 DUF3046 domain-containing protein [Gordonia sp. PDNC005]
MRLTEFNEMVGIEFGRLRSDAMLVDHVLIELGGRTGAQAIADGVDPREVWRALCRDFEVPPERW